MKPTLALVNEQAYSGGLVGHYLDAGYRALLMDWDNPSAHHPEWTAKRAICRRRRSEPTGARSISCGPTRSHSRSCSVTRTATSNSTIISISSARIAAPNSARCASMQRRARSSISARDATAPRKRCPASEWQRVAGAFAQLRGLEGMRLMTPVGRARAHERRRPARALRLETRRVPGAGEEAAQVQPHALGGDGPRRHRDQCRLPAHLFRDRQCET